MIDGLERNCQVKRYIETLFGQEDNDLLFTRQNSKQEGLKEIQVPISVGKLIYLLAKLQNPKKILEIGTLGGYSTLWLARALAAGGKILTLEYEEMHTQIARKHFNRTEYANSIEVRLGNALDLLPEIAEKGEGPFDLIFIDADKENYPKYLSWAIQLSRSRTLILSDNLIPKRGEIASPDPRDTEATQIYEFNQQMAAHPQLESSVITTIVGENGRVDGLGIALVL